MDMGPSTIGRQVDDNSGRVRYDPRRLMVVSGHGAIIDAIVPVIGAVAQLGERLVCNQEVGGSIPLGSSV